MFAASTLMAGAFGVVSSPSGQQLIEQAAQAQSAQVMQSQRVGGGNAQAQAQRATTPQQTRTNLLMNPYFYPGGGFTSYVGAGMSPKEYGQWLLATGKNKYNDRRNKHWRKA